MAHDVREWCLKHGDNPKFRIVLAGYDVEHAELEQHGWTVHEWFTQGFLSGGMGNVKKKVVTEDGEEEAGHQQHRERLWASPHCVQKSDKPAQLTMFGDDDA